MISIVWTYRVKPDKAAEFERRYSSDGDWARLFARAAGYGETLLLRDLKQSGRYLTIDRWDSPAAFAEFKRSFAAEYEKLDRICDSLTETEERIGVFESAGL